MTTYLPTLVKSLILSAVLFFSINSSYASTDYVDADWAEIEAAIVSGTADTIRFNFAGVVNATNAILIGRDVVIISPAARLVEFDGGNGGFEAFAIAPGAGGNVWIQGIAFLNFNNSAINIGNGIVKIKSCLFEANSSGGAGGAIEWSTGTGKLEIYESSFVNNTASNGGAIFSNDDLLIENSMFHQNIATTGNAGAVDVFSGLGAFPILAFNTFYDNRALGGTGGALYSDPVAFLYNNLFTQNVAGGFADADFTSAVSSQGFNYFINPGSTSLGLGGSDVVGSIAGDLRAARTHDGYGLRYFPIVNEFSILVDVGTSYGGVGQFDIRRGPRNMDGDGNGAVNWDIGCVEYSFFTVTNTDGGTGVPGSLGKVLQDLTFFSPVGQPYYVAFDVIGDITPGAQYPQINKKLEIDGFTQDGSRVPGYKDIGSGFPIKSGEMGVSLVGPGGINNGLTVAGGASGTKISGFSITNFDVAGIEVTASDIQIAGNHIGVDVTGNVPGPNGTGIFLQSATSNVIGGGSVIERNLISANAGPLGAGIHLFDALDNIIDNNLIGTTKDGTGNMGNFEGIVFQGTSQTNKVGSAIMDRFSYAGQPYLVPSNTISGNFNGTDGSGILFDGAQVTLNSVGGNYIGTEISGATMATSNFWGVSFINDANGNRIGDGGDALGRNVVSSNQDAGIYFHATAADNDLFNNWVGLSGNGLGTAANLYGLRIDQNAGGYSMTVGGPGALDRNVFSGNTSVGIFLSSAQGVATTNRLVFENNIVGLDPTGLAARPNGLGVSMSSARWVTFGSDACAGCGNIVSGNAPGEGIGIGGPTNDIIFYNNFIGVNSAGNTFPNSDGIFASGTASWITIGGTNANQGNEIATNNGSGVYAIGSVLGVDITGNSIHDNGGAASLGMDINNDGVTPNDASDADGGPNNRQNFPVITNAFECNGGGSTQIDYTCDFQLGNNYSIQFYIADADNQEGQIYLGEQIINPAAAPENFTYFHGSIITPGSVIVANAAEIVGTLYHSSEFSAPFTVGAPVATITPTNPILCGSSDGTLAISFSPSLLASTNYNVTYDYEGSPVGPVGITTDASGELLIPGLDSGTFNYIVVDISGCQDTTVGPWVLSYPNVPNPVITGPFTVCQDSTETYNVTGDGGTFSWSIAGGSLSTTVGATTDATWNPPSAANIQVIETIGSCIASDLQTVTITPSDVATYSITALTRCQSGVDITCSITGTPGGTFSATPGGLSLTAGTGAIDVSASTPGVYSFIYTTPGPCTAVSVPVNVTINADDDPSFTYSSASECTNGTDITATITGTGGGTFSAVPGAGLSLNAVTGDIDVSASTPGAYTVTYTTAGICPANSNLGVTIIALDDPTFSMSVSSECVSGPDITASITGTGGGTFTAAPAGLSINSGTGLIDVSVSTPGVYTVTYTTPGVCSQLSNLGITINADDDPSYTYSSASECVSGTDITATITGTAGGSFVAVPAGLSINAGSGLIDVSASTPGAYTITYTTSGFCPANSNLGVTIIADDDPNFSLSSIAACNNSSDITATISGTPGGTFTAPGMTINAVTGTIDVSATAPGVYAVTYTTPGVCSQVMNIPGVTINPDPTVAAGVDQQVCADVPTVTLAGSVTNATGGTWTGGAGTFAPDANTLTATYTPTAGEITTGFVNLTLTTSGNGFCNAEVDVMTITYNPLPTFSVSTFNPTTCGGSDGVLGIDGLDPSTLYNVQYDDPSPVGPVGLTSDAGGTILLTGLPAGTYTNLIITSVAGCATTDAGPYVLVDPLPPTADAGTAFSVCAGDPATLGGTPTATGGTGSYTFAWDNGAAPVANPSLIPGSTTTYTVTVTDVSTSCVDLASVTVTVNALPTPFIGGNANVCEGAVENYTVSAFPTTVWTLSTPNGSSITNSTSSSENLTAGTSVGSVDSLFVSVTDPLGCTGLDTILITIQNNPSFSISTVSPTTCGGANGSFTLSGLSPSTVYNITYDDDGTGVGPLAIASDGLGDIPILGLDAGTYNNIFAELTGCSGTDGASYTLLDPPSPVITAVTYNNPTTCGGTDGSIVITLSGTSPAGNYNIDIDGGGTDYFAITNTGSALTLSGLASGISVTSLSIDHVTTLCTDADPSTGTLVDPPSPVIDSVAYHNPTTCGGTDGYIEIFLSPGSPGGTYGIDVDGGGNDYFVAAGAGNILTVPGLSDGFTVSSLSVEVTATACSTSDPSTGTLSDPPSPLAVAGGDTTMCVGDSYTLGGAPTGSGGLGGPYTYSWDNGAGTASNPTVSPTVTTQYIVQVTETSTTCATEDTTIVTINATPAPIIVGPMTVCQGDIAIYKVATGNALLWSPTNGVLLSSAADSCVIQWNLSGAGIVDVIETLGACSGNSSLGIVINAKPDMSTANPLFADPLCFGASDGTGIFTLPAGPPEQWFWDGVPGINSINTLASGSHEAIYVDANGCRDTNNFVLNDPPLLVVTGVPTDESCLGSADGSATVSSVGGAPGVGYTWYSDPTLTTSIGVGTSISGLGAGTYYVEGIDANSCDDVDTVIIGSGPPISVTITQSVTDSCVNSNSIDFGTAGGPYVSYAWNFAAGTPATGSTSNETVSFTGVGLHQVYVDVVDGAGCAGSDSIYINIVDTAVVAASPIDPSCAGITDGQIVVNSSGGSGTYNVDLDGTGPVSGASLLFTSLPAGPHSVVVTDGNGCVSGPIAVILTDPTPLSFDTIVTSATCGLSNGIISVTNEAGGSPAYQYSFDGGTFSAIGTSTGYAPGSYDVVMTDQNGCLDSTIAVVGTIGTLPNTPVLAGPYIFCEGDVFGPITATGTISPGTFDWYIDDTTSAAIASTAGTSATFGTLPSGSHTLYVIHTLTASGCASASGSATIEYWPNDHTMSNVFTVCPGGQVQVDGTVTTGTITWDPSADISNAFDPAAIINPSADSSVYFYTHDNSAACAYLDSILVVYDTAGCGGVLPDISNAFSPDGNGINDGWFIEGLTTNTDNHVTIFNRWGDVIHEFIGYNNADVMWMGDNQNGDLMPPGTYFYVIELTDSNVSRSGWVQLTK